MNNFVVSARKYRPSKFNEVTGQAAITKTLQNAVVSGHIAQAYLFCGPRGVGKTTVARILAKAINCSHSGPDGEPCNRCESCISFNENRAFNIHELDAASNNKVEDIKSLIDQVRIPPQIGRYSVYIIDEVHMLSASAFNAFLKTLEEPPDYAVFIMATTEKQKIIPTILSRCQIYDFQRIRVDDIVNYLQFVAKSENVEAETGSLNIIAQKADGALRDALSTFDQLVSFAGNQLTYETVIQNLNVLDYDYYFKLTDLLHDGNFGVSVQLLDEILIKGFDIRDIIGGLARHFRELLMAKDEKTVVLMEVGKTIRERYLEQAAAIPATFLTEAIEICYQSDVTYRTSKNPRLHAEIMILQICGLKKKPVTDHQALKPDIPEPKTVKPPKKTSEHPSEPVAVNKTESATAKKTDVESVSPPPGTITDKEISVETDVSPEKNAGNQKKNEVKPDSVAGIADTGPVDNRSVSIKGVLNGLQNGSGNDNNAGSTKVAENASEYIDGEDKEITPERLTKEWLNYADTIQQDKPRFASALRTHLPRLEPPATISLIFDNKNLREDFDRNLKNDLQDYLVSSLHNRMITFDIQVEKQDAAKKKPYTAEEKYKQMKAKNPGIEVLKRQFNLDFE
ncbi:MAG: DNA polymerase III subunit gamma/tau [Chlorobi bacterium]|nr:DNA polymerase III subunit gamma/tau [Chlorobiota bacterium]